MLLRERRPMPATRPLLPAPAPLPSLRDALGRRAAIFGPFDAEPAPAASLGAWRPLGALARRVADALDPHSRRFVEGRIAHWLDSIALRPASAS